MKRTIPLLIAAMAGYVLVSSRFIPLAEKWGEVEAIWFDILAAIAFVLGGGSLLKLHLRRISDRTSGWGYSAITLIAFLATLYVGVAKTGARPSQEQEFYGQSFAPLTVEDLPPSLTYRVPGSIPTRADREPLPLDVQRQLSQDGGDIVFRGWMTSKQEADLSDYKDELAWHCTVEKLFDTAQPPAALKGKVSYLADYSQLGFRGFMTDADHEALLKVGTNAPFVAAVDALWAASREETQVSVEKLPAGFSVPAASARVPLLRRSDSQAWHSRPDVGGPAGRAGPRPLSARAADDVRATSGFRQRCRIPRRQAERSAGPDTRGGPGEGLVDQRTAVCLE